MLVLTLLLYGGLNRMIFLFRWFLLLAVSIFNLYLSLWLYHDLSKASCYGATESLKISSEEDNAESRDSMESGGCLMIDGGCLLRNTVTSKYKKKNTKIKDKISKKEKEILKNKEALHRFDINEESNYFFTTKDHNFQTTQQSD